MRDAGCTGLGDRLLGLGGEGGRPRRMGTPPISSRALATPELACPRLWVSTSVAESHWPGFQSWLCHSRPAPRPGQGDCLPICKMGSRFRTARPALPRPGPGARAERGAGAPGAAAADPGLPRPPPLPVVNHCSRPATQESPAGRKHRVAMETGPPRRPRRVGPRGPRAAQSGPWRWALTHCAAPASRPRARLCAPSPAALRAQLAPRTPLSLRPAGTCPSRPSRTPAGQGGGRGPSPAGAGATCRPRSGWRVRAPSGEGLVLPGRPVPPPSSTSSSVFCTCAPKA